MGNNSVKKRSVRLTGLLKFGIKLFLIYNGFVIFIILYFRFIPPASSAFMNTSVDNPIINLFTSSDLNYTPVPIDQITRYSVLAVVASEDQRFFEHFGFDFEQIEKAMKENTRRKRIRGASTITMQVAKNLFLWPGKNIIRKGFEAYYTLMLELLWSKKRIVEVYLNIAEMGKGIYGVESASKIYFKKSNSKISMAQAAILAAVLPNPKKRNPGKPSGYLISRRDQIMNQMGALGGVASLKKFLD